MCGIIAYKGDQKCLPFLFDGLQKLEYRGYDSVGISYIYNDFIVTKKQQGYVDSLKKTVDLDIESNIGIGHTRWATHGDANSINAHPHTTSDNRLSIVHNGIVENYETLKKAWLVRGSNVLKIKSIDSRGSVTMETNMVVNL